MADNSAGTSPEPGAYFPYFRLLPPELRRKIYILATPPRVVHVHEEEDEDSYEKYMELVEKCRTTPVQFKLHQDIAYFAGNWRPQIHADLQLHQEIQPTLEEFGFTSTKGQYLPWTPDDNKPPISALYLSDNPHIAWDMTRDAYLFSAAPIPPLVHVCSESREVLMRYGYELAFGTRTHEPRTWFNFKRDTLYLKYTEPDQLLLLSGGPWDVGLFRPTDLIRVKKLALQGCEFTFERIMRAIGDRPTDMISAESVGGLLRLLPGVQELSIVGWGPELISDWAECDFQHQYPALRIEKTDPSTRLESRYVCVPIDEIDIITLECPHGESLGWNPYISLFPFKELGVKTHFLDTQAARFQTLLSQQLGKASVNSSESTEGQLKLPRVKLVHLCPLQMVPYLFAMRQQFWLEFLVATRRRQSSKHLDLVAAIERRGYNTSQNIGDTCLRADRSNWDEYWESVVSAHPESFRGDLDWFGDDWWFNASCIPSPEFDYLLFPPRFDCI